MELSVCAESQADSRITRKGTAVKSHWAFKIVMEGEWENFTEKKLLPGDSWIRSV